MQSASNWEARDRATAAARERFVTGSDCRETAVRPEILFSWLRCRDEYKIDPGQSRAPSADDYCDHSLKNDWVMTELGSIGRSLLEDVEALGALVAITDGAARILTAWGDRQALRHGEQSNLAPWFAWLEQATGTNGIGTALEYPEGILVRRCEHWCEDLQDWSCAGTTIRDPVTGQALAVLDVSSWGNPLPDTILPWLHRAVEGVETELREQALRDISDLEEALRRRCRHTPSPTFALDAGGGVVAVNNQGEALDGVSRLTITTDCPALREFVRKGVIRARADHSWVGYAGCFIPCIGDVVPFTIRPVVKNNRVIGALGTLGESAGEQLSPDARSTESSSGPPQRVAAFQGNRLIILHPQQIIFAEAERNTVWLTTDRGRIRARERGLERLVGQLHDRGFIRVHRHFVVNARRVREIKHGFRGQLSLVMDPWSRKTIPVSRRREPTVRRALELLFLAI
jgi:sigma-54 dependent transcriptional regulator, acetoin dehydrogenase operon transcriptional activator AcoR